MLIATVLTLGLSPVRMRGMVTLLELPSHYLWVIILILPGAHHGRLGVSVHQPDCLGAAGNLRGGTGPATPAPAGQTTPENQC
jgi:hypothetical protein